MNKRKQFRELIERDEVVIRPSVHDPLTARIADMVGFETIGASGYGASLSTLGLPDAGYLTMSEMVENARNVAAAVDIPVLADADTGFGNALNVRRTTREFIDHTDVAAFFMEDQRAPKRCGHVAGKQLVSKEEAVGKFRAAADVRDELDEDFVIMARTDAIGAVGGSVDEAIERGNLYAEAGADIIFVEGPTNIEDVKRIGEEVDAPLTYNQAGVSPLLDAETLEEYGFAMAGVVASLMPTITTVYDHFEGLRDEGMDHIIEFRESIEDHPAGNLHEFAGFDEVNELEKEYLPEEEQEKYVNTIGHNPNE